MPEIKKPVTPSKFEPSDFKKVPLDNKLKNLYSDILEDKEINLKAPFEYYK
jgi:hypothetical protein